MLQPYGRVSEGWSTVSTRPQVRAHDDVQFRHFTGDVVLRHFIGDVHHNGRRSTARRVPSISTLNQRQHQVEAMEMHVRRNRMARRSRPLQRRLPPSLWRCPSTKRISEELPETQTRWSPGFSPIACLVLSQWSTPGSPASSRISIDG